MRFLTLAITVLLAWALPSAVAQAGAPDSQPRAGISAVKKPGLKKALKKCRTIKKAKQRKACVRKARKRFADKPSKPVKPKPGKTWRVDVLDSYELDYFSPNDLQIKVGDSIEWVWSDNNQNPHDITPENLPPGIDRNDYRTANAPSRNYRWVRRFDKAGSWSFSCSLHFQMKMTIKVEK